LIENRLGCFGHVERSLVDDIVRRVYQMEESHVKRGRWKSRKTIKKKPLEMI